MNIKRMNQVKSEEIVFRGKIGSVIHTVRNIKGSDRLYEQFIRPPGTRSIVISPENKILLTREFRINLNGWDYRLPRGKVVDSFDEYERLLKEPDSLIDQAKTGAMREVREEAGIVTQNPEFLCVTSCGTDTVEWDLYYFVIKDFSVGPQQLDGDESVEVGWYSLSEAGEMALVGKMQESRTAGILLEYLYKLGAVKVNW